MMNDVSRCMLSVPIPGRAFSSARPRSGRDAPIKGRRTGDLEDSQVDRRRPGGCSTEVMMKDTRSQRGRGARGAVRRDLDVFIAFYNEQRTHQGYRLKGRTPAQALREALGIETTCLRPAQRPARDRGGNHARADRLNRKPRCHDCRGITELVHPDHPDHCDVAPETRGLPPDQTRRTPQGRNQAPKRRRQNLSPRRRHRQTGQRHSGRTER